MRSRPGPRPTSARPSDIRSISMRSATARAALLLDFAHMSQQVAEVPIPPGTAIDADLAFFPGALPLRALVKERHGPPSPTAEIGGYARIADACAAWAEA